MHCKLFDDRFIFTRRCFVVWQLHSFVVVVCCNGKKFVSHEEVRMSGEARRQFVSDANTLEACDNKKTCDQSLSFCFGEKISSIQRNFAYKHN